MAVAVAEPLVSRESRVAPRAERVYYPALDGLRAIAFLMVFSHHCIHTLYPNLGFWSSAAMECGGYGLTLFFVLSSFLITTLLLKEQAKEGTIHIRAFYMRRVLRIWPLYFLILVVSQILGPREAWTVPGFMIFGGNFWMANGLWPGAAASVLWSICVEEQFYVVWPWVAKYLSARNFALFGGGLVVAGLVFRLFYVGKSPDMWFQTGTHLDCFGIGCLAALFGHKLKLRNDLRKYALVALSFLCIYAIECIGRFKEFGGSITLVGVAGYSLTAAACGLIVYCASVITSGVLTSKVFVNLGKISFGLYCWHGTTIALAGALAGRFGHGRIAFGVLWFVGTVLAAYISYKVYEAPFLKLKSKFQFVKSGGSPAAA